MSRRLASLSLTSVAAVLMSVASSASGAASGAACRVQTLPEGWAPDAVHWEGACIGEKADGLGVLKDMQGTTVRRVFVGRASKGDLLLGVLEEPGKPFVAGHFDKGRLLVTEERWPAISAFEEAAKASEEAAARLEAAGDKAGAQALRDKSVTFRKQMD